jgi:class 3 adenylate cyclase
VGIFEAYATLGRIGFEGCYDYAAIGVVTNLAWHLCDEADGEQILISPRIYGAVEVLIESETVGELSLKGSSRPILVYNIIGLRGPLPTSVKPPCYSDCVGGRPLPLPVVAMTSL